MDKRRKLDNPVKQKARGGARKGAGRKKGKPTKTLSYRVPLKLAKKIDKQIRTFISDFLKIA